MPFLTKENLFSEHYLLNVLSKNPEWVALEELSTALRPRILELLSRQQTFDSLTEPDLDREFFDPIFRLLGHVAHIQVRTEAGDFPDYVFFESEEIKRQAEGS